MSIIKQAWSLEPEFFKIEIYIHLLKENIGKKHK